MLRYRRIYEPVEAKDGFRILVDRLWPRGPKRGNAAFDEWLKIIAPSNELRTWYGHHQERWTEFEARYRGELTSPEAVRELGRLREIAASGTLTLLTATRAIETSHLAVLRELLA
jgi:uncharacterized protein YeaO (DUF488 family)